jgi:hypothetical protein
MIANFRLNCVCGVIYDVIEASGYSKDQRPSKVRLERQGIILTGQSYWSNAARLAPLRGRSWL